MLPRCRQQAAIVCTLLLGLLFCAYGHALCLEGEKTVDIITPYHFSAPVIRVNAGVPLGTVIATAVIPEGSVIARCGGDVQEGIWSSRGAHQRFVTVSTDVAGVSVRVISEKQARAEVVSVPARQWNARPPQYLITQGGIRIELVKTGPLQPGMLTSVSEDVQYRLYAGTAVHPRLIMRERLRYRGQLRIDVMAAGAVRARQRLS